MAIGRNMTEQVRYSKNAASLAIKKANTDIEVMDIIRNTDGVDVIHMAAAFHKLRMLHLLKEDAYVTEYLFEYTYRLPISSIIEFCSISRTILNLVSFVPITFSQRWCIPVLYGIIIKSKYLFDDVDRHMDIKYLNSIHELLSIVSKSNLMYNYNGYMVPHPFNVYIFNFLITALTTVHKTRHTNKTTYYCDAVKVDHIVLYIETSAKLYTYNYNAMGIMYFTLIKRFDELQQNHIVKICNSIKSYTITHKIHPTENIFMHKLIVKSLEMLKPVNS